MLVPVVTGPTAVGKTALAVLIGGEARVEVVSADSRQVYRGLEIGTAAPSRADRAAVPHHGVGFVDPRERYSAGRFARDARGWVACIAGRGARPLVVGGTGLYLRALFEGLFEEPELDADRRRRLGEWLGGRPRAELECWAGRLIAAFAEAGRSAPSARSKSPCSRGARSARSGRNGAPRRRRCGRGTRC